MKENRSDKTSEKGRGNRSADGLRRWLDLNWPYLVLCCGFFGICLYCSCNILVTEAPDEYARHLVSAYIFQTGSLPTGLEPETRIPIWGFSYALNPYLAQIFSACFMRAISLVSANPSALVIAARFASVISGTVSVFVMCKIGELVFDGQRLPALLPGLLLAALPQFLFISSYENNDVFSIFCCLLVTYCWFRAWKRGWSLNLCLGLGISIGLLALSYYNAYGFILLSIPVFFMLPMRQSGPRGGGIVSDQRLLNRFEVLATRGGMVFHP